MAIDARFHGQPNAKGPIEWMETKLTGQDSLAVRAAKKMDRDELLMTKMGGTRLRLELDKVPLWRGDHVSLKLLADDFAKYEALKKSLESEMKKWEELQVQIEKIIA